MLGSQTLSHHRLLRLDRVWNGLDWQNYADSEVTMFLIYLHHIPGTYTPAHPEDIK